MVASRCPKCGHKLDFFNYYIDINGDCYCKHCNHKLSSLGI